MTHPVPAVALRVLVVLFLLQAAVHRPPYVVIGAPQPVETEHPVLCVHTRLTDEVEEWKIQRSLQMVREMGATTIVEFFPWAYIEGKPGEYHWEHSDMVIEHAHAQGLRVVARLGTVPQWAQPLPQNEQEVLSSLNHLEPDRFDEFARFVEMFTARYRGKVDAVIIWNEPNLAFEWGYQEVQPEQYVELLRLAYPAAHRGNPEVRVLAGALAPTLEPVGSPNGMDDLEYLSRLYDAGFAEVYDALAVHTYGFRFPPEDAPAPNVLNFRRAELLRAVMVEHGDSAKPVIVTESGWNDHPRWTKAVRPGQRITYTIDALELAEQDWAWADAVCLWALRYPAPVRSWPDYFTLVTDDFTSKPIYEEIQRWARGWEAPGGG